MIYADEVPTVIEHTLATQGIHGLGHRGSAGVNEIGNVLLSERYLKRVAMRAWGSKHQGKFAQGFNEPRFDLFGKESDQLPFGPFLQNSSSAQRKVANSGLSPTRLFSS